MNPRQIGLKNQKRSVQFILRNEHKYGLSSERQFLKSGKCVLSSDRIHNVGVGHFQGDLFGRFDIMTMPYGNEYPIYLVQVKSKSFSLSKTADLDYFNELSSFQVPDGVIKELHIWQDHLQTPKIITL